MASSPTRASSSATGAVIGARALVNRDVPPYTIVGGMPAKPIRRRFSDDVIAALTDMRRWDWPGERIRCNITAIQRGSIEELN